jgi:two-component system chemotaxis response regulator CheY
MAHILAVDDSRSLRMLVRETLVADGHEVTQAADGVQALTLAERGAFDLVISDVNMPNMDGLTLLRRLRALPGFTTCPFLILTTVMDPEVRKQARAAGATGWVVKPFTPEQLQSAIRRLVSERRAGPT